VDEFLTAPFWLAVGQIIMIDILLGDNAVGIACVSPIATRIAIEGDSRGTAGAIVLRVILIAFALTLLQIPFLKLVGAALLTHGSQSSSLRPPMTKTPTLNIPGSDKLGPAVKTVIVADLVMSIETSSPFAGAANGAASHHQLSLVVFGLLVSIPIIIWGSQLVMKIMDRFPIIITVGNAFRLDRGNHGDQRPCRSRACSADAVVELRVWCHRSACRLLVGDAEQ